MRPECRQRASRPKESDNGAGRGAEMMAGRVVWIFFRKLCSSKNLEKYEETTYAHLIAHCGPFMLFYDTGG